MSSDNLTGELPEAIQNAENLPSLPAAAIEVLRLTRDEDATVHDLADAISSDPALAAKILKLANSPHYSRGMDITTLSRACSVLGMKTVKLMALSFSLASSLPTSGSVGGFDYAVYWRHSLTTAVAARGLGRLVKSPYSEEAFLAGLLARIGQLVIAESCPESYAQVAANSTDTLPSSATELVILGYDNHRVAASVLARWDIPQLLVDGIRFCDDVEAIPDDSPDGTFNLCSLVHIADSIAKVMWETDKGVALKRVHELASAQFGLADSEIDLFFVGCDAEMAETASALNVSMDSSRDHQKILEEARHQLVQISLESVINERQTEERAQELELEKEQLLVTATTDALTGLANRAHFDATFDRIIAARMEGVSENSLGVLMMDIDHFKSFNDTYGHLLGDEILKYVSHRLTSCVRNTDFLARYGGEEFVVVLPNTSPSDLESIAERLRSQIAGEPFKDDDKMLSITISVGGAYVRRITTKKDGRLLLDLADKCLYEAKHNGRNCCVCRNEELATAAI